MGQTKSTIAFDDQRAIEWLDQADDAALDEVDFGVVAMNADGNVVAYNVVESTLSGLSPARVVGRNFFNDVAPCANNYMVAQRYLDEISLDETLPYIFTVRMVPRRVRLRLLKSEGGARRYLLVDTLQ
jgi:photoactive yellow protein